MVGIRRRKIETADAIGEDPDTFVAKFGGAAMEKLLTTSLDVCERKVQLLESGGWVADLQRKRRAPAPLTPGVGGEGGGGAGRG